VAQLLRDNAADARVADDVAALAAAYDEESVAASAAALVAATEDDLEALANAFGEPPSGEPWWRDVTAQALRYRWWVATSLAIIAVILFVHPAPLPAADDEGGGTSLIPTNDSPQALASVPSVVPEISVSDPFSFAIGSPAPSFEAPTEQTATFNTTPVTYAPAPTALRITQSGYASTLAGTPADQAPPADGLPVESLGGRVTKYSYIRLVGSGASLKLKALSDDGAALNDAEARVQLCHITTAGWKATRDAATADAPKYNEECVEGHLANAVWTFAFSSIQNPVDPNGWAIVPVTTGNPTFRVTFAPTAAS
jgi:hypothetical protein